VRSAIWCQTAMLAIWYPAWAPNASMVAFLSNRSGNPEIWVIDRDGSNPSQLTATNTWHSGPALAPSRSRSFGLVPRAFVASVRSLPVTLPTPQPPLPKRVPRASPRTLDQVPSRDGFARRCSRMNAAVVTGSRFVIRALTASNPTASSL
jgi:hypothetical protein